MSSARTRGTTPDLFSHTSVREPSTPSQNQPSSSHVVAKAVNNLTSPRHVLPKNLAAGVKQLGDGELDQLLSAVLDEKKRRGQKPSEHRLGKRQVEPPLIPLTRGQISAVRAACKAGVRPTRIARQFGLSQSDVRKALSDMKLG